MVSARNVRACVFLFLIFISKSFQTYLGKVARILQYVFPKDKNILLCNHSIVIKFGEFGTLQKLFTFVILIKFFRI